MAIPHTVESGLQKLMSRTQRLGVKADRTERQNLATLPCSCMPEWLLDLLSEYPLTGLRIGIRVTDAVEGFHEEPVLFEIGDSNLICQLNTESYPGKYLFPRGYVALGCGIEWAGDILVMATTSDDPPLYQVWHDVSHDPAELEEAVLSGARGTRMIAASLSDFFAEGLVEPLEGRSI